MGAPDLYVVIHETRYGTYGVTGGLHDRPPVIHLAYCRDRAERKDIQGRYFIARLTEIPDARLTEIPDPEPEYGP